MRNVLKIVIMLCFFIIGLTAAGSVEAKSVDVSRRLTSGSSDAEVSLVAAAAITCDHTIGLKVSKANGRENYAQVKPGDTVCIEAGTRNELILQNFEGTAQNPITFINHGGQVFFNGSTDFAIEIQHSRYFRFTGTGDPNYEYGFKVDGNYVKGVNVNRRSSDMEIDHIEVANTSGAGITANNKANCSDGSDNKFDYDGDGKIKYDLDDVTTQDNFVQYNTIIHHTYIRNTQAEGFYIGPNRTAYASYGQSGPGPCPTSPTYPLNPILDGVQIYANILERIGYDAINVKGVPNGCFIYDNEVYENGLTVNRNVYQEGAVSLSLNSNCDVYNNYLEGGQGPGIKSTGIGGKIYNNVIVGVGQGHAVDDKPGSGIFLNKGIKNKEFYVWNNTIVTPKSYGIYFNYEYGTDNLIQNNIVVDPGSGYIQASNQADVTISHNLKYSSLAEAKFVDPAAKDYSLISESLAVDAGIDLSPEGITNDYLGNPRPQGTTYDIGAYEVTTDDAPPTIPSDPYLNIQPIQAEVFPGDTVEVKVDVKNSKDLYGLQVTCSVDPAILSWQNATFGNFFSDPLIGAKTMDVAAGSWVGAISQKNPAPALSGDGAFATLTFEAVAPGTTTVTCEPLASDRDGFQLPISTSDDSITVLDTTNVEGSLEGMITYQGRNEHSAITVMATGPVIRSVQAQSSGQFQIDALKDGDYDIKADTELYLPSCAIVTVGNGQIAALTAAVLAGGDSDDDDEIKINDATLIGSNFGLSASSTPVMDPRADINADGEVNIKDLSILGGNFGKQGCQEWSVTSTTDTSS